MNYTKLQCRLGSCIVVVLAIGLLSGCHPPTFEEFAAYPSLRQKWLLICDPRSNLAEVNPDGCKHFFEWQAANGFTARDTVVNKEVGQ